MADTRYRGYKSYSYLTLADDFEAFDLDDELGRCPATSSASPSRRLSGPAA